jgi:hypothetical protein
MEAGLAWRVTSLSTHAAADGICWQELMYFWTAHCVAWYLAGGNSCESLSPFSSWQVLQLPGASMNL